MKAKKNKKLTKKNREKLVMADVRTLSPLALEWLVLAHSGNGAIKKVSLGYGYHDKRLANLATQTLVSTEDGMFDGRATATRIAEGLIDAKWSGSDGGLAAAVLRGEAFRLAATRRVAVLRVAAVMLVGGNTVGVPRTLTLKENDLLNK